MAENRRIVRVTRIVRSSIHGLLDRSQPFGRLALVHTLQAAGTACVTVSLAGSLFFSVSLHEAKGKVLLYLVLTIAPFALVGPALSPLLDRGRDARRDRDRRRALEHRHAAGQCHRDDQRRTPGAGVVACRRRAAEVKSAAVKRHELEFARHSRTAADFLARAERRRRCAKLSLHRRWNRSGQRRPHRSRRAGGRDRGGFTGRNTDRAYPAR